MVSLDDFDEVRVCTYKGETYSVRDNGAIMRHQKEGKKKRPNDNKWTFGKPQKEGYVHFCGIGVHRIVATAFHGNPPTDEHVCDHYDTNRQNNRPENLRWVTKLENILNNPYTHEKIIRICGSIENFLNDPDKYKDMLNVHNKFPWMGAVTKEEARMSLERLDNWLAMPYKSFRRDNELSNKTVSNVKVLANSKNSLSTIHHSEKEKEKGKELTWDDIKRDLAIPPSYDKKFNHAISKSFMSMEEKEDIPYTKSRTKYALQPSWFKTDYYFPRCPKVKGNLQDYYQNLNIGGVLNFNKLGKTIIEEKAFVNSHIIIKCLMPQHPILYGCVMDIYLNPEGEYIHDCVGTYWHEDGLEKYFQIRQGKEWLGGDVMDDYL